MRTALALLLTAPLVAQTASGESPETERFDKKVRPILTSNCYACHGPKMQMGGLNLSSGSGAGPETGVVVKGDPEQSRLMRALGYADKIKMPPSGKLSAADIATVKT